MPAAGGPRAHETLEAVGGVGGWRAAARPSACYEVVRSPGPGQHPQPARRATVTSQRGMATSSHNKVVWRWKPDHQLGTFPNSLPPTLAIRKSIGFTCITDSCILELTS